MTIRRVSLIATSILLAVAWLARPVVLAKQLPPPSKAPSTASAPPSSAAKVPDIVIDQLDTTVRFETDGTGEYQTAARIRVLTDGAVQQLAQMPYYYDASIGTARFEHLEVRKPSGQVSRAAPDAITDTAIQVLPNVMTGLHQLRAPVPGLARGDLIDYRVVAKIAHPQIAGEFWWQHRFTVTAPVTTETLTIDVPSSRPVQVKTAHGFEAAPPEGEPRDGRRIYRWTRSNPEVKPLTELAQKASEGRLDPPDVLMTTFRSWDELGRWYLDAARDRDKPDAAIVAKAEELTRGLTSASDKLRALYEFVATESRYLSLSFGTGALVPHKASEVLANRYGDCKDRHTLLAALARAVGIRTYPALISSSQVLERDLPTPAQTDHMITVGALGPNESDWVWMDSASGVAPFGLILPQLRNKVAVVLVDGATTRSGDGGAQVARLVTTPAAPPFPCFRRTRVEARLSAVGTLEGRVTFEVRGDDEVTTRMVLRVLSADDRTDFLKTLARGIGLTGELTEPSIPDSAVARDPLRLAFRIRQEGYFDRSKAKTLDLPIEATTLPYANETDWKDKIYLKPWSLPEEATVSATIDLPAGFLPKLPVDVTLTRDYAQYRSTHRFDGSRLTVERVLTVNAVELPAPRMRDYLAFVSAVRSDEAQDISLDTTKAAPASASTDTTPTELYRLGLSQFDARDYAGALQTWKRVTALAPKHPDAWDALGLAYEKVFQWTDAIQAFQQQVEVEPFHKQAWNHLGWALQHVQKRLEAIAAYRKQIEIVPLDKYAHRNLGELLLEDPADNKGAASELATAEQMAPDDAGVAAGLGLALIRLGDTAKGLVEIESARKLSPGPGLLGKLAYELIDDGTEFDRGAAYAKEALGLAEADSLKLDPKAVTMDDLERSLALPTSWHALGWAAFKKGDYARAEKYLSAARSAMSAPDVSDHLSQVMEKLGRRSDAARFAAESLIYEQTAPYRGSRAVRERLVRLSAGSDAIADQALEPARAAILWERSAQFARVSPKNGNIRFMAIFTNGSQQPQVLALTHDPDLEPALAHVRKASFRVVFPDGTPARVISEGVMVCQEKGQDCFTVVFMGGSFWSPAGATKR